MKKKIVSIILCLCMMLPFSLAVHAQEPLNYLLFGDSIAQRFGVYNSLNSHYNTGMLQISISEWCVKKNKAGQRKIHR